MSNGSGARGNVSLGTVFGVPVRVSASWFIVAAVLTVLFERVVDAFLSDLGAWSYAVSFAFAVLLYLSVFLHEISHAVAARVLGQSVLGITLHFLGGYTEIDRGESAPGRDIVVSAAGPLVSLVLGGAAATALPLVDHHVAWFLLFEVAVANIVVGVFNALPALPLDGGHVLRAVVWKLTGDEQRGTVVAGRAGQVLAVLVLAVPFIWAQGVPNMYMLGWAALLAVVLWSGASRALRVGQIRARLPELRAGSLARATHLVPYGLSLSEASRQATQAGASTLLVVDSAERPTGLVSQDAAAAVPDSRRAWVTVGELARPIEPGLTLSRALEGDELLAAIRETPANEYLVLDDAGAVLGVLRRSDVDAALATG